MQKDSKQITSRRNTQTSKKLSIQSSKQKEKRSQEDFVQLLPLEITLRIFHELDIQSLCNAAMTCKMWNHTIENCDHLWKHHCLSVRALCQREIDRDRGNGCSWKPKQSLGSGHPVTSSRKTPSPSSCEFPFLLNSPLPIYFHQVTLLRNYWKSKVKHEWLSGKYSNIHSHNGLPEKSMYPMDVETWGEILEAELER
ncbi:hypothetical protein lerEdw1_018539 [Lerista edwardsae]|nr:hypothetical protein lerEdw1_018539 [Lerista edwardsae]